MVLAVRELHPCRGREFRLADGVVIGRGSDCGLPLEDPLVSRHHARVLISELGAGIEDLDSANGVYVNGGDAAASPHFTPGTSSSSAAPGCRWTRSAAERRQRGSRDYVVVGDEGGGVLPAQPNDPPREPDISLSNEASLPRGSHWAHVGV